MQSQGSIRERLKRQAPLQLFVLLGMLFLGVFKFIPMFGIIIAFKDYKLSTGIGGFFTSQWNHFAHFIEFFNDYRFWNYVSNTLRLSLAKLVFSFFVPLILAIMLSEVRRPAFKRVAQTASYLPHFISWVIIVGICNTFFSESNGVLNKIMLSLGMIKKAIPFTSSPKHYIGLATFTAVWKEAGWWAIIYLAAISGIDPTLYESAQIDGATRMQRIIHVTIPVIKGSIITVLILSIGNLIGGGLVGSNFEQGYLLGNLSNNRTSEIIQTYAFKVGMGKGRYDFAAAIDLIQSMISVLLIFSTNAISKKLTHYGLF